MRRGFPFAIAVTVLAAFTTFMLVKQAPRIYQASSTILASQPDSGLKSFNVSLVTAPPVGVSAYEAAVKGFPVLKRALVELGDASPTRTAIDDLRNKLSITAEQDTNSSLIHVQVRGQDPNGAATQANAVAASLLTWDKNRAASHLQTIVETLQGQIKSLDAEIANAQSTGSGTASDISSLQQLKGQQMLELNAANALKNSAVGRLEIVTPAQAPLTAVEPRPKLAAAIAAVLALMAAYLFTFLRSALDSKYRSIDELARDADLNILGEFPKLGPKAGLLPRERVNFLRTNLSFASASIHPKVFVITSADPGDGKTTVAVNLAEAYARNEYRTLLIDADLRKPDVGHLLGVQPEASWDLLALLQNPSREISLRSIDVDGATFHVLPTSRESTRATELLSRAFKGVLDRIQDFDVIVIDSAPILPVADTLTIAPHASGVILSASLVDTNKRRMRGALALLHRLGVHVMGLAVTQVPETQAKRRGSGYGYGYGYGNGYGPDGEKRRATTRGEGRRRNVAASVISDQSSPKESEVTS
jgi:capsular exopolysaccharide synthesis family protein